MVLLDEVEREGIQGIVGPVAIVSCAGPELTLQLIAEDRNKGTVLFGVCGKRICPEIDRARH
jgi:hypothetical protein